MKRIDSVCGVTWIPLCARDGSVIAWGRGEGETLSIHVVSTQCASGLTVNKWIYCSEIYTVCPKYVRQYLMEKFTNFTIYNIQWKKFTIFEYIAS